MAPRQTQANFGGPFLEQMDFGFFTEKGLFCRDIANPPCVIALMFMNVLHLDSFQELAMFDSVYKSRCRRTRG
jgi:hypothetical protein